MPALPSFIVEPIWVQFSALLPVTTNCHPWGCHRPRIPARDRSFLLAVNRFVFVSDATRRDFGFRIGAAAGPVVYDGIALPEPGPLAEPRPSRTRSAGSPA